MNALIIEDEKLVTRELIAALADADPAVRIVGTVGSIKTALRWFAGNAEPDLIFADGQLADGLSFTVFETFQLSCPIIFTTAYNESAIKAFKANGIDYLLKPVDENELRQAIARVRALTKQAGKVAVDSQQLMKALNVPTTRKPVYKEHFLGNARNSWVPVHTADIAYFVRDQLNFMVTNTSERYILDYDTLDEIELLLDPTRFDRASRHCLVSIDAVQRVKGMANLKRQLMLKAPNHQFDIDISRDKVPSFKKWLEQ